MRIEPFEMERWQSLNEHEVEINLSDSGVHPIAVRDLVRSTDEAEGLLGTRLDYTQTNGTPALRRAIAELYPDATPDCVEVVNGGAEANFVAVWSLVGPGDEVVVMLPNYMQVPGIVRGLGAEIRPWPLVADFEAGRWRPDLEGLEGLVGERTRMIAICNPNNPTGARLTASELDAVCAIADRSGAWVLSDEIYQGSELDGQVSPTVWRRYERAVVTNSLSKSYGLPGLRLGWIVAQPAAVEDFWLHHDYTTIAPGALSDHLACLALSRRSELLERARGMLRENLAIVTGWIDDSPGLRCIPPEAGGMLWLEYDQPIGSTELARRLLDERSVLIVPGDHYGMDGWIRIGFGGETERVREGLGRLDGLLAGISA